MHAWQLIAMLVVVAVSGCVGELPGNSEHGHAEAEHVGEGGHEGTSGHDAEGHDMHAQTGMERPDFSNGQGSVPTADEAAAFEQKSSIRIIGDDGFRPAQGVRGGNGTPEDPFIIEHWYVAGDLYIQDTDACFILRENYIGGQLSLNWNGICVYVHHNYIHDLRVNENIRRTGYITGGLLEHNDIGFIGQLRHYDGEFAYNQVGPRPDSAPWDPILETTPLLAQNLLVANIDGFNQGLIHNNTFEGSVDLDFHGHHHGTGFFAPHSHYHGDDEERKMPHDHTKRWTSVSFADNYVIDTKGYGLRYEDRNHAGDDRTANSEKEETLADPHVHRSMIDILGNTIEGGGVWVDVFNADDKLHEVRNDGWLTIAGNNVFVQGRDQGPLGLWSSQVSNTGILVQSAKEVDMAIYDNHLSYKPVEAGALDVLDPVVYPAAIALETMHDANITVHDNVASGFHTGVRALRFDEVGWKLYGNQFDVEVPLEADDSVPMPGE